MEREQEQAQTWKSALSNYLEDSKNTVEHGTDHVVILDPESGLFLCRERESRQAMCLFAVFFRIQSRALDLPKKSGEGEPNMKNFVIHLFTRHQKHRNARSSRV